MKKNNAIRETRRDRIFLNVLLAISVVILIRELYPVVYVVSASFSSSDAISRGQVYLLPVEFSLDGYKMLSKNKDILTGFTNSVLYLIVGTSINMLLTVALAYPLSRKELPFRNMLTLFILSLIHI